MKPLTLAALGAAALLSVAASRSPIVVTGAWTRPAPAGMTAAGYMTLVNRGRRNDALVGASAPWAASVQVHKSAMMGSMMTMRPVAALPLPAGGRARLAPGGYHLMIEGLKRPLKLGEQVPVVLKFRSGAPLRVELTVGEGPPAGGGHADAMSGGAMPGMK
ncbi:MAG TPA: copper chaperone PCu(A)C [Caulobacteraceae bacterium]|nr:copper chaperone PCu(A)C [Caulobacteraceae bacterium]